MPKKLTDKTTKQALTDKQKSLSGFNNLSPMFNVITLVLLLLSVFAGMRLLSKRQTAGQVKFIENSQSESDQTDDGKTKVYPSPEIFRGEVYDTAIRLRETGALGMAISLTVISASAERGSVPQNLEQIWRLISERKLLPPGLELNDRELISPSGKIEVRYQSQPLRFEIISRPKNDSSPAILLRFPLESLDGRTITYFQSASVDRVEIPPPFASREKIVANGWTLEQWRGEIFPKTENMKKVLEEENRFLESSNR